MSTKAADSSIGCPSLVSNYRTPRILWYQTDNAVFIRILLTDVDRYSIKVECDSFKFSSLLNDVHYFVGMKLCGTVVAEKTSHQNLGREIKVCLIKAHKWTDWPRLQLSKDKSPFITVDPDHIIKKRWDDPSANLDDRESFTEYKKRMNITNIMPPQSSSSAGSDSDDERMIGYD